MTTLGQSDQALIERLVALGKSTSATILNFYGNKSALNTQNKSNNTPLTDADLAAHELLAEKLPTIINIPFVSEESSPAEHQVAHDDYWLVDPIDGTRDFIKQTGEFCIAIARIKASRPVIGFIYAPTTDQYWVALQQKGAYTGNAKTAKLSLSPIHSARRSAATRIITSRSAQFPLLQQFVTQTNLVHERLYRGSALKFCAIAEGKADLYPKLSSSTSQWDIAAGELILNEAGGGLIMQGQEVIEYGPKQPMLNSPFVAYGASIDNSQLEIWRQFMQDNIPIEPI